ncbi:MAG: hypothetical protein ACTSYM_13260 [Candidatus Baldrarchaeia archaeon]
MLNWAEIWVGGKRSKEKGERIFLLRVEIAVPLGVELPKNFHKVGVDYSGRTVFASQWQTEVAKIRAEIRALTIFLVSQGVKVLSFEEIRTVKEYKENKT